MPLTNFYNFLGCPVPSISSCTLQDNSNVDRSGGITLDTANQNIKFLSQNNYWTNPAWISGKTFTLRCTDASGNAYTSNSFKLDYYDSSVDQYY